MSDKFSVVEKSLGPVVEIKESVPVWKMPATFSRDFEKINQYLESNGAKCAGMPFARYIGMDWETELNRSKLSNFMAMFFKKWQFYAGLPSSESLDSENELEARLSPPHKYVRTIHKGPYQDVGPTYKALFDWAESQGITLQNEAIEFYLNDPHQVDKKDIETEILIPMA